MIERESTASTTTLQSGEEIRLRITDNGAVFKE